MRANISNNSKVNDHIPTNSLVARVFDSLLAMYIDYQGYSYEINRHHKLECPCIFNQAVHFPSIFLLR